MKSKDEILNLSADELGTKLEEMYEEMGNLKLQKASHQLNNPMRIRQVRRNIARVKTMQIEYQNNTRVLNSEQK
jgi:large subunit ribosomal protein L29